jgi:CdiI immunity protein
MTSNQFPELSDILGSYFHQDWHDEFISDDAALHTIIRGESSERLKSTAAEIDTLLREGLAPEALRSFATVELGCFFEPQSRNLTWEEWLRHVKSKFEMAG